MNADPNKLKGKNRDGETKLMERSEENNRKSRTEDKKGNLNGRIDRYEYAWNVNCIVW